MGPRLTDSRLANLGAAEVHQAYDAYARAFRTITRRAQARFEACDWRGMHNDALERLLLYQRVVVSLQKTITTLLEERLRDKLIWAGLKAVYSGLITDRDDWEQAETFFNSLTRKIFATVGLDPHIEFVDTDFATPPRKARTPVYRTYHRAPQTDTVLQAVLEDAPFSLPWRDAVGDSTAAARLLETHLDQAGALPFIERIEMIRSIFYRGKRAYLIGRVFSGLHVVPLVFALRNTGGTIAVDAVLLQENEVSIVFSFTRSYFHVDIDRPYDLTRFLRSLMPRKRIAELYLSIGYNKHGKTEIYRDLRHHLAATDDRFHIAPGTPGMVMLAFVMPGYDLMFKVIRDRFPPPKTTTRETIREKYRMVFIHDRAGRLVEAQQFEFLKFQRARFTRALLEEFASEASESVQVGPDTVVLNHVYIERRVIPLNVFLREAEPSAAEAAILEYGNAIKDLAATNIFPGDMLIKNFGVTRHGRVVFYDYDELTFITACRFRRLPPPRTEDEVLASEPWYVVAPNDIFPEEFRTFLGIPTDLRAAFEAHHGDLYEASFWNGLKSRLKRGEIIHIAPYGLSQRLREALAENTLHEAREERSQ